MKKFILASILSNGTFLVLIAEDKKVIEPLELKIGDDSDLTLSDELMTTITELRESNLQVVNLPARVAITVEFDEKEKTLGLVSSVDTGGENKRKSRDLSPLDPSLKCLESY